MGLTGKYPPVEGWTLLVPPKLAPQPTPKSEPEPAKQSK